MNKNRITVASVSRGEKLRQIANNLQQDLREYNYIWEIVAITDNDIIIRIQRKGEIVDRSVFDMGVQLFERI